MIKILIFAFCIFNFSACATIKEGAKRVAGLSTKVLEDNRKGAIKKAFNYDYSTCYNKTETILKNIGTYIYVKNKEMFAVYVSTEDTTPVGLFFISKDANNTEIEVSSPSTFALEFISGKVFAALEKSLKPDEKGKPDAKKEMGYK